MIQIQTQAWNFEPQKSFPLARGAKEREKICFQGTEEKFFLYLKRCVNTYDTYIEWARDSGVSISI